jgi:hypothetical protein
MRRLGEGVGDLGGVAKMIVQRHIVRDVIVELRRAGFCRFLGAGHGRQRVDIQHHGFAGVARLRQRLSHHKRHGVADKTHLVADQCGTVRLQQRRAVAALQRQAAGVGAVIRRREVGAGPDAQHARHRLRGCGVDAANDAVRVAGAHDPGIDLAGQREIVGVFTLAADQRVVFLAADRLPNAEFLQCDSVILGVAGRVILHCRIPGMAIFYAFWWSHCR